ncbi:MAG TPA: hypothetical protein VJH75_03535 [Patescibacteria group bacterium]|nr:hypothetical protein [Patescibacteria group bacterium]
MPDQLFGDQLRHRDVTNIIEVAALKHHNDLKKVAGVILRDLRNDRAGETISYTLHYAVESLLRIGYKPRDVAEAFADTEFAQEVIERIKKITKKTK